ncbi:hypothetical protein QTP88_026765 [Uroleucon formosanum]
MLNVLESWGPQGWTTPICNPRANPVERRNQDLKKRGNKQTGYPPTVLILGRECKRPGDWALSKSTKAHIGKSQEERVMREKRVLNKKLVIKPSTYADAPVKFGKGDVVY